MVHVVVVLAHAFNNNQRPLAVGESLDVPCTMAPGLTFSRYQRESENGPVVHIFEFFGVSRFYLTSRNVFTQPPLKKNEFQLKSASFSFLRNLDIIPDPTSSHLCCKETP